MRRDRLSLACFFLIVATCACNLGLFPATSSVANQNSQPTVGASPASPSVTPGVTATSGPTSTSSNGSQPAISQPCAVPVAWTQYVVMRGDTLNGIAQRAGLTAQNLAAANCLA